MTNPKKLSRRDAIKLLGAAVGATALANLPSKWSTPELVSGVMPAHAQTSLCVAITITGFDQSNDFNTKILIGTGPFPDSVGSPFPFEYYCKAACVVETYYVISGTLTVYITQLGVPTSFTLGSSGPGLYGYMFDLSNGTLTLYPDTPPSGCSWPVLDG